MELAFYLISIVAFAAGIMLGESLSMLSFGRPRSWPVYIMEVFLIVLTISAFSSSMSFSRLDYVYHFATFLTGLISIMLIRAVECALKLTVRVFYRGPQVVGIIRKLAHYGLETEEIRDVLMEMGLPGKNMSKYDGFIEKAVPRRLMRRKA
jgi:hypothetical protein